jgi:hypothetical protein
MDCIGKPVSALFAKPHDCSGFFFGRKASPQFIPLKIHFAHIDIAAAYCQM